MKSELHFSRSVASCTEICVGDRTIGLVISMRVRVIVGLDDTYLWHGDGTKKPPEPALQEDDGMSGLKKRGRSLS